MKISRRQFGKWAAATTVASVMPVLNAPAIAQGSTSLKMILNWRYQGPQSWFFLAQDKGYLAEAGIDVTMDQAVVPGRRWDR